MADDDTIRSLQEALAHSATNIPLREHLGKALLQCARFNEAEMLYREGLEFAPNDTRLKMGLATCFHKQGKDAEALVLTEELVRAADAPSSAFMLHVRLLIREGDIKQAVASYKELLKRDPSAEDPELGARLGVTAADMTETNDVWRDSNDVVDGRVRNMAEAPGGNTIAPMERPATTFDDVGGMAELKEEIRMKIIFPLTHPEIYDAYGKSTGGGILLYGPPGCGKTHLARATAGEVNAGFVSVGISDVLDMWIGQSERNLHELFEYARAHQPCVLFFDEVDALGASRTDLRQSAGRHLINQFLAELDGIESNNNGLLILAATNAPWHLDAAFRRPGRFDQIVFVPPPDQLAREEVLRVLLTGKPVDRIDFAKLAKKTEHFSGADLKALIETTIEDKLRVAMKTGKPEPIVTRDLVNAVSRIKPSTREWFSSARNYALYSNQGGVYDDILKHLNIRK